MKNVTELFTYYVPENMGSHTVEVIVRLYQPFIGHQAMVLYMTFFAGKLPKEVQSYYELLQITGFSHEELEVALVKLEGAKLIRTFINDKDVIVYEILQPLSKEKFLAEPSFVQLLELHCEQKYVDRLKEEVKISQSYLKELGELRNVSQNFKNVFGNQIIAKKVDVLQDETIFSQQDASSEQLFSWDTFMLYLPNMIREKLVVNRELKKSVEELASFHMLESKQMAEVFTKSYQETKGVITPESLKSVATEYSLKVLKKENRSEPQQKQNDVSVSDASSGIDISSETTRQAFFQMKNMRSSEYIQLLTRNYTPKDKEIIENLHFDYHFPEEVINVLLDYAYKSSKPRGLNWKFIEAIAQQWSKAQVESAEDAYHAIVDFAQARKEYQNSQKTTKYAARRTEIVPDFDKKNDIVEDEEKLQAEFDAMMNALREEE